MRLIDADALKMALYAEIDEKHMVSGCITETGRGLDDAVDFVLQSPTLDAVPVVRCRECKHYRCSMSAVYRHCALHKGLAMVAPDSFCSYGERRE